MINSLLKDGILRIQLNRPEKKNAFTRDMYLELSKVLECGDENTGVKVFLVYGAGGAFSSGNDISDFIESPISHENSPPIELLKVLATLKKPLVAAVDGVAVGIGATMLFHCDLVYANQSAKFIFPFVSLGLVPEGAISLLLPKLVGHQRASEILYFGEAISAQEAHQLGFVNRLVNESSALPYAEMRVKAIAKLPQGSLLHTKKLLKGSAIETDVLNQIHSEGKIFINRLSSLSAKEALSAFMEKRAPNFEGLD